MLDIGIKELNISMELKRKIEMICRFHNLKCEFINGSIKNIIRTNLAYIEPHKLEINNITYLFFNECENVYINSLEEFISFNDLEAHIKANKTKPIDF